MTKARIDSSPGTFLSTRGSTAQEYEIYLVDVNGDGKIDIAVAPNTGPVNDFSIHVLLNRRREVQEG